MWCREKQVNICSTSRLCIMHEYSFIVLTWCNFLQTDCLESLFFGSDGVKTSFWWMHIWDQCIRANLQFWFHQMPFGLGDGVWWPLVMYGETVVHHLLFLVGELLIWCTFTFYTKHWCPLSAFDFFYTMVEETSCLLDGRVGGSWWGWPCDVGLPCQCEGRSAMVPLVSKYKYEFH